MALNESKLNKISNSLSFFKEHADEVALIWSPHPLLESTLISMRPHLFVEYNKIVSKFCDEGWGIFDNTDDLNRAIVICDGYFGDEISLVELSRLAKKPILIESRNIIEV